VTVGCRFKTPDRVRLERVASASGLTLSDWVRGLVLDALDTADDVPERASCGSVSTPAGGPV
jgi:hypothetical protein